MEITDTSTAFTMPGNWEQLSKKLKDKYEHLTDADLKYEFGKENELLACIAARLHMKRDEVIAIIQEG